MTSDTPPASIATVVRSAERLRMELLDARRRAPSEAERASAVPELVMLFGQAFERVYDACARQPSPQPVTLKMLHECVCGMAIYRVWLISETPMDASEDYERMAAHWQRVIDRRVGEERCRHSPLSEPCVRLSPHTAQAWITPVKGRSFVTDRPLT
jgi:hypothetical protein